MRYASPSSGILLATGLVEGLGLGLGLGLRPRSCIVLAIS